MSSRHTMKFNFDVGGASLEQISAQIEKTVKYLAVANEYIALFNRNIKEGKTVNEQAVKTYKQYVAGIKVASEHMQNLRAAEEQRNVIQDKLARGLIDQTDAAELNLATQREINGELEDRKKLIEKTLRSSRMAGPPAELGRPPSMTRPATGAGTPPLGPIFGMIDMGPAVKSISVAQKLQKKWGDMVAWTKANYKGIGPVLARIKKRVDRVTKGIQRAARAVRAWGRNFLWLGRDITVFTAMALGAAIKATTAWAKFEEQLVVTQRVMRRREGIQGMTDDMEDMTSASEVLYGSWGVMGDLVGVADEMAVGISAATASFGSLVRAGYEIEQAVTVANQAMILFRGSQISLSDATKMMINVQKYWKDEMYSAIQIADIMTVADENAEASLSSLNAGMGFAMGTASRLGMSLEQTAAAMTLLTNAGFSGSVAGRELRSVLNNLMQNAEDYGIQIKDAANEMLPFESILQNVEDRLGYFDTELEKSQYLQEVFGETNLSLVQTLMENRSELNKLTDAYGDSGGAAQKAADDMKLTLEYQLDRVRTAVEKVILVIGKGFGEALVDTDDFMEGFIVTLNTALPQIEAFARAFGEGFVDSVQVWIGIAQDAIDKLESLGSTFGLITNNATDGTKNIDGMGRAVGGVAGFAIVAGPALMGVGIVLELLSPVMFAVSAIATVLSTVFGVLTTVAGFLTPVLAALGAIGLGPILLIVGLVILAIIVVIGAFMAFQENVDSITASFAILNPLLQGLQALLGGLWSIISPIIGLIMLWGKVMFLINMIIFGLAMKVLEFIGIFHLFGFAIDVVGKILAGFGEIVQRVFDILSGVGDFFQSIVDIIFGKSPGLIPGLEASTEAMKDFNTEAAGMKDVNVDLADSLSGTTEGMYNMAEPNLSSYGTTGTGMGGMVEIGPDTRTWLMQLLGKESEMDWSTPEVTPSVKTPTTTKRVTGPNAQRGLLGGVTVR